MHQILAAFVLVFFFQVIAMLFLQLLKDHFVDENRRLLFIHSAGKDWSTQKD